MGKRVEVSEDVEEGEQYHGRGGEKVGDLLGLPVGEEPVAPVFDLHERVERWNGPRVAPRPAWAEERCAVQLKEHEREEPDGALQQCDEPRKENASRVELEMKNGRRSRRRRRRKKKEWMRRPAMCNEE